MLEDDNFTDTNEYLRNSPSLKKWVACSLKQDPPDKPWEYSAESSVTEIERVISKARRAVTNAITSMERRLQSYNGDIIGEIGAKVDA